ncbi:hypothetical protein SRHO_G00052660 [Serrasalmus rhombeus]
MQSWHFSSCAGQSQGVNCTADVRLCNLRPLKEREPLILSQQALGLSFGLVSSAQREPFLNRLPRGGAPAPATNTEPEVGGVDQKQRGADRG